MKTDIVILSKDQILLSRCLSSICMHVDKKSTGKIVIGWTGKDACEEQDFMLYGFDITIESLEHYNFAKNNNYLVEQHCTSEVVLFMNDDVELVEDSVTKCLKCLQNDEVGTVGIKLLYPDRTIQHAGIFMAVKDSKFAGVGHLNHREPDKALSDYVVIGNTGAFLMVRRCDFDKVGGFDENYQHYFEDVQLNLQIRMFRQRNICNNSTWAWHIESATRKQAFCKEDAFRLQSFVNKAKTVLDLNGKKED